MHVVHIVAAGCESVLVTDPAVQLEHEVLESLSRSALPAEQAVHAVAPLSLSMFVVDPALQTAHALVDTLLYWPATHAVQLAAPADSSVLVTAPA